MYVSCGNQRGEASYQLRLAWQSENICRKREARSHFFQGCRQFLSVLIKGEKKAPKIERILMINNFAKSSQKNFPGEKLVFALALWETPQIKHYPSHHPKSNAVVFLEELSLFVL